MSDYIFSRDEFIGEKLANEFMSEKLNDELYLAHYGTKRHSGRYPYGSGENPYQHEPWYKFMLEVEAKKDELGPDASATAIAHALGMSTTEYRAKLSNASNRERAAQRAEAIRLYEKGMSKSAIGREMGLNESTIRSLLDDSIAERKSRTQVVSDILKDQIENKSPYIDIGKGVEIQLGVSQERLKAAVALLEEEGYKQYSFHVEQATNPGKYTEIKVLCKPGTTYAELRKNQDQIRSPMGTWVENDGRTVRDIRTPVSISSDRISICYAEDGGKLKDGVIEIRPGVKDLTLGENAYAQVRIAVDGTHYIKGMAVYNDDLPPGVDIRFNTNKTSDVPKMEVLKPMKTDKETGEIDWDNPFGSTLRRQIDYIDSDGEEKLSAVNIVNDDESWGSWSKNLASQFLSKQPEKLARQQLDLVYKQKVDEFSDIMAVTQPEVRKKLLESFAEDCDADAVALKAAKFPGQETKVILPVNSLADGECYCPTLPNGEEVVLVRYPHAGPFESPRLRNNTNNPEAKSSLGNASYAIGINSNVADQLSGADFDGDTVVVIPTRGQNIRTKPKLDGLKDFDPQIAYKAYDGMPPSDAEHGFHKQIEMGKVSNLITDMTIQGASDDELARAVRHSMVVIDAEKHNLDWRTSYEDNGIAELKQKYQGGKNRGASTLISKASSEVRDDERKVFNYKEATVDPETGKLTNGIDPETGEKIYGYTHATYEKVKKVKDPETGEIDYIPTGKIYKKTTTTTQMEMAKDAYELSSGTVIESVYADHANKLKSLANEARKAWIVTPDTKVNKSAKEAYKNEVASLTEKLALAEANAPNERLAQLAANKIIAEKKRANPDMDKEEIKKLSSQVLASCRRRAGTTSRKDREIEITDREWEAIQAGAVSHDKLERILKQANLEELQKRATPRTTTGLSPAKIDRARALLNSGHTWADVAEILDVPVSTLRYEVSKKE